VSRILPADAGKETVVKKSYMTPFDRILEWYAVFTWVFWFLAVLIMKQNTLENVTIFFICALITTLGCGVVLSESIRTRLGLAFLARRLLTTEDLNQKLAMMARDLQLMSEALSQKYNQNANSPNFNPHLEATIAANEVAFRAKSDEFWEIVKAAEDCVQGFHVLESSGGNRSFKLYLPDRKPEA